MRTPWADKTGLSKQAAILSTVLLVSIGLCGVNFAAVWRYVPIGGSGDPRGSIPWLGNFLIPAGFAELIGIFVSAAGLVVIGGIAVYRSLTRTSQDREPRP